MQSTAKVLEELVTESKNSYHQNSILLFSSKYDHIIIIIKEIKTLLIVSLLYMYM